MASISQKSRYRVIGLMSGTSLDGLDIALCDFRKLTAGWKYSIEQSATVRYTSKWQERLSAAHTLSGELLAHLDAEYGKWLGQQVRKFLDKHGLKADFVASHGHTVFHQPGKGFTTQVGSGFHLHVASGLPVVYDFRSLDVAMGGEGAPLVPAGDKLLFADYDVCLNLGGIANLSLEVKRQRIAFDICYCNMGLNMLAAEASKPYDKNGDMASDGEVNPTLLKALTRVYTRLRKQRPSLGRELYERDVAPLLADKSIPLPDRLATFTEAIAIEVCDAIRAHRKEGRIMCTGGGAFNGYLMTRFLEHGGDALTFILPDEDIVKFKEAMVFAFLGVLRVRNEVNCLRSVTRASADSSSGLMLGFR